MVCPNSWITANIRFIGDDVGRVQLIFCIALPKDQFMIGGLGSPAFLAYVKWLDIVPQAESLHSACRQVGPDPVTNILVLEWSYRSGGLLVGDIIPLQQLQGPVQLTLVFGKKAHICLTAYNSLHFSS